MCGPEDPLFTPPLEFARVPFQAKSQFTGPPFEKIFEILPSTASIFAQNLAHKPPNLEIFSSQAPNLENFSSQAPKFGKFQFTSPLFRGKYQFASPTLRKSGPHTPTWKKLSAPGVTRSARYAAMHGQKGRFNIFATAGLRIQSAPARNSPKESGSLRHEGLSQNQ